VEIILIILVALIVINIFIEAILGLLSYVIPEHIRHQMAIWFGFFMLIWGAVTGWFVAGWIDDSLLSKLIGGGIGVLLIIGLSKRSEDAKK